MKANYYDFLLQGSEATEENAIDCANGLDWSEIETYEADYPYLTYVDTINGIDIWYNYGHDAYYFTEEIN